MTAWQCRVSSLEPLAPLKVPQRDPKLMKGLRESSGLGQAHSRTKGHSKALGGFDGMGAREEPIRTREGFLAAATRQGEKDQPPWNT